MISVPVQLGLFFAASAHSSGLRKEVPKFIFFLHAKLGYFERISGLSTGGSVVGNIGLLVG